MGRCFTNGVEEEPAGQSIGPTTAAQWQECAERWRVERDEAREAYDAIRCVERERDEARVSLAACDASREAIITATVLWLQTAPADWAGEGAWGDWMARMPALLAEHPLWSDDSGPPSRSKEEPK